AQPGGDDRERHCRHDNLQCTQAEHEPAHPDEAVPRQLKRNHEKKKCDTEFGDGGDLSDIGYGDGPEPRYIFCEGTQAERAEDKRGGEEAKDRAQFQPPEKRYDHACRGQKQQQFLVIFRSRSHQLRSVAVRSAPAVGGVRPAPPRSYEHAQHRQRCSDTRSAHCRRPSNLTFAPPADGRLLECPIPKTTRKAPSGVRTASPKTNGIAAFAVTASFTPRWYANTLLMSTTRPCRRASTSTFAAQFGSERNSHDLALNADRTSVNITFPLGRRPDLALVPINKSRWS